MKRSRLKLILSVLPLLSVLGASLLAQDASTGAAAAEAAIKDVDPLAMRVLKAVADPLQQAQTFSFKALVSEEDLASNDQLITSFHVIDVTVQRPDKVHIIFKGRGPRVELYTAAGSAYLYAPESKLYVSLPGKENISAYIDALHDRGIDMPVAPFLRSDFYTLAEKLVRTAYVIGRVQVFDQDVHQLAFTSEDADWQVWVTGGENPRFVRAEIVNKDLDGSPRTVIQFLDWNLNPSISPDEMTFTKPADAHQIEFISIEGGN